MEETVLQRGVVTTTMSDLCLNENMELTVLYLPTYLIYLEVGYVLYDCSVLVGL